MLYLFSERGDVSLKGRMHPVEGLGFAEVLPNIIRQLFQLLLDLSHKVLPVIKVPLKRGINVSLFCSVRFTISFIILPTIINAKLPCLSYIVCGTFIAARWLSVISCSLHQYHSYLFGLTALQD